MFCTVRSIYSILLILGLLTIAPLSAYSKEIKKPPKNEALIPFVAEKNAWDRLNPAFPFYPVDRLPLMQPTALSQAQYARYWSRWDALWPHIDYFNTLFEKAEKGKDTTEVQLLSAKVSIFLLKFDQVFDEAESEQFQQLESYQRLTSMQNGLHELLYLLKAKGSPYIHYRGYQSDIDEEEVAIRLVMLNLRQDIRSVVQYKEMLTLFEKGFLPTDK